MGWLRDGSHQQVRLGLCLVGLVTVLCYCSKSVEGLQGLSLQPGLGRAINAPVAFELEDSDDLIRRSSSGRSKRDAGAAAETHSNFTTAVTTLNDTHKSLMVHWAGGEVIICLAKDLYDANSSSTLYVSTDYGGTFTDVTGHLGKSMPEGGEPLVDKFFGHPENNGKLIFTDVTHNYIFTTTDYGKEFRGTKVLFVPDEIYFHPHASDTILAYEKSTEDKRLWLSEDFGGSWTMIEEFVESISWDESVTPAELYILRKEPVDEGGVILTSKSLFVEHHDTITVLSGVDEFEIKDDYKFATKRNESGTRKLLISFKGGPFLPALFPTNTAVMNYHIADVADGQVFICVTHNNSVSNLYIGSIPLHSKESPKFSLSLERIVFFKPNLTWAESWLNELSQDEFVDLHKVEGLRGVYIASVLKSTADKDSIRYDQVVSVVTFDNGGEWRPLDTPKEDDEGQPIYCVLAGQNCSLHVSQRFSQLFPQVRGVPVLSKKSAVGLVMATGVISSSMKGRGPGALGVFMSNDGAATWKQVLQGNYLFGFGDHGGVMVAVKMYKLGHSTNVLKYSTDEGHTWKSYQFYKEDVRVLGLLTEPGENRTVFFIFGSVTGNSTGNTTTPSSHSWVLIRVDLMGAFERVCSADDYKKWSPWDDKPDKDCLLGRKDVYERRIPSHSCYNGRDYERKIDSRTCVCDRIDFECDFGFTEDPTDANRCVKDASEYSPGVKAEWCRPGDEFFNKTKGYRKIPNDACVGGDVERYLPESRPCGVTKVPEFLIVAKRDSVLRINLNDHMQVETLPVSQARGIVAVDFDFANNVLYWSDVTEDQILRLRLDGNSTVEVVVSADVKSVEGIAFDWISRNLYFVDSSEPMPKIEVIRTDVSIMGRMRKKLLSKPTVEKPRGIAVHPEKGYMFWTDWSSTNPCIGKAWLDGTKAEKIITNSGKSSPIIQWPNGISIDYLSDRLYWVDARLDQISSANLDGSDFKVFMGGDNRLHHPFAVTNFKDNVYWNDWLTHAIYGTNKNTTGPKSSAFLVSGNFTRLMDMKTIYAAKQLGQNACTKANCSHLCLSQPGVDKFVCACPDGLKSSGDSCVCPDGLPVQDNGMCSHASCNESNVFTCKTGNFCIPDGWKCDGDHDCADGSDEDPELCSHTHQCVSSQFLCAADNKCIPNAWRCDYDNDCSDGADEKDCEHQYPTCDLASHFQCDNKKCILRKWLCDGDNDCYDGSDEKNCTSPAPPACEMYQFQCANHKCIDAQWKCDGEPDCGDGSDEESCPNITCSAGKMKCHSSQECIMQAWVCDGENDCVDGSDEWNCTQAYTTPKPFIWGNCSHMPGMFECSKSKHCIPDSWRCDKVVDCGPSDDSDEAGCPGSSTPDENTTVKTDDRRCSIDHWKCDSGDCIIQSSVCDGFPDCPDQSDEKSCTNSTSRVCPTGFVRCGLSSVCIKDQLFCDGKKDCPNGADESYCDNGGTIQIPCNAGQHGCSDGHCVPLYQVCDGELQCMDGSDEMSCIKREQVYQIDGISPEPGTTSIEIEWWMNSDLVRKSRVSKEEVMYGPTICEAKGGEKVCNFTQNPNNTKAWKAQISKFTFEGLKPYTEYIVTVLVRAPPNGVVYPPFVYRTVRTLESEPSEPYNLVISQPDVDRLCASWSKPLQMNGQLAGYELFFTPPTPAAKIDSVNETVCISNKQSNPPFTPDLTYYFWVIAKNGYGVPSKKSHRVGYTFKGDFVKLENLAVKDVGVNSAKLTWSSSDVDHRVNISCRALNRNEYPRVARYSVSEKGHSADVQNLPPNVTQQCEVTPVNKDGFRGTSSSVTFTTKGEAIPKVFNLQMDNSDGSYKVSWTERSNSKKEYKYAVFYGISVGDLRNMTKPIVTSATSIVLKQLEGCETYFVDVAHIQDKVYGPLTGSPVLFTTSVDLNSAPKRLKIERVQDDNVTIGWDAPCSPMSKAIGYNITIVDKKTNMQGGVSNVSYSSNSHLTHWFLAKYGAEYDIILSTASPKGRLTPPLTVRGPSIPYPDHLTTCSSCQIPTITWDKPSLPTGMNQTGLKYVIYVSSSPNFPHQDTQRFETAEHIYSLQGLLSGSINYVAVALMDGDDYESPKSTPILVQSLGADTIEITKTSVLEVVVVVIAVMAVLVVALSVFVFRHKKLKTTFIEFARSHYNSQSGSATFHQSPDQDAPIIQGFSDDEPLLVV